MLYKSIRRVRKHKGQGREIISSLSLDRAWASTTCWLPDGRERESSFNGNTCVLIFKLIVRHSLYLGLWEKEFATRVTCSFFLLHAFRLTRSQSHSLYTYVTIAVQGKFTVRFNLCLLDWLCYEDNNRGSCDRRQKKTRDWRGSGEEKRRSGESRCGASNRSSSVWPFDHSLS